MARRTALSDEEILAHARSVFLERGYAARTKQIAPAVGLMLTRTAVAMLTGDVAQRFVARKRTLAPDPAFIGAVVSLLSAH